MNETLQKEKIYNTLRNLKGLEPLKQLFWTELNYDRLNEPISRSGWTETQSGALAEDPVLFASAGQDEEFKVLYLRLNSEKLLLGKERAIIHKLLSNFPYSLFVISNNRQDKWHFLNVKYDKKTDKRRLYRRITIGRDEKLRTATERITLLDVERMQRTLFGLRPLEIQEQHDEAFDVEAITKQFFEGFCDVFEEIQKDLSYQTNDKPWAHDYALQLLSRIMFLYFIQRKRWLGDDTEFLKIFWESYRKETGKNNTFFEKWLNVLFFEAFNNRYNYGHKHFPENIKEILQMAPYLNGGLFEENKYDTKHTFNVSDDMFETIFDFYEKYNFTIAEDSPFDKEVAVDPEMIGKVYESLVNVSPDIEERGDAGIFYTPRTEIDMMCRLSLVDNMANHLGNEHKNHFYEAVFAYDDESKQEADKAINELHLWERINNYLKEITVLDPACGSGSFLVGMLYVLDDLRERAQNYLNVKEDSFDRKKGIIGQNLYGVDVKEWACRIAELRLWLALIIDAEIPPEERHIRREPLLPNFTFKIRPGDSLVQEFGGHNLSQLRGGIQLSGSMKTKITNLKTDKMQFFYNVPERKYRRKEDVELAERKIFGDILEDQIYMINNKIAGLRKRLEEPEGDQVSIDGTIEDNARQTQVLEKQWRDEIEILNNEKDLIEETIKKLKFEKQVPFVWDISFVEIFESDKKGFDIVIGNPPYVRQESICDPRLHRNEVTTQNKREYKAKLAQTIYQTYPVYFGYNKRTGTPKKKIDSKSDLYVYFYLNGMSLLNDKGSFCFITSNSWLDVGYGKNLQEFLLKHSHVKMVIDNQAKRSFSSADINTVIVLFSAPHEGKKTGLEKTARFVMFRVPFEHILSPVVFEEIEETNERKSYKEYRIFPANQKKLYEDGCEMPEDKEKVSGPLIKVAKYSGNKWGGKYLRAPDIYWTILEKGKGKFVRLGDIATVRFGIKTGANEFFYLPSKHFDIKKEGEFYRLIPKYKGLPDDFKIEEEYLQSVIKSPRECKSIFVNPNNLSQKIFMCNKSKAEMSGSGSIKYVEWGEKRHFNKIPSCKSRKRWWDLGVWQYPDMIWSDAYNERYATFSIPQDNYADKRFFYIYPRNSKSFGITRLYLNSTIIPLFIENEGIANLAEGVIYTNVYWLKKLPVLYDIDGTFSLKKFRDKQAESIFTELGINPNQPIHSQKPNPLPDRKALDDIIFNILELTKEERNEVYWSVCELVKNRLEKANSI